MTREPFGVSESRTSRNTAACAAGRSRLALRGGTNEKYPTVKRGIFESVVEPGAQNFMR